MDNLGSTIRWWRHTGYAGGHIAAHRSMRTSRPDHIPLLLTLPLLFDVVLWRMADQVTAAWSRVLAFWFEALRLDGYIAQVEYRIGGYLIFKVPLPDLLSGAPTNFNWWVTLAALLGILLVSIWIPEKYLHVRYVLRCLALIQGTALVYFAVMPNAFPYDLPRYISGTFLARLVLIAVIPWLLAFTYYLFEFGIHQKIALTAIAMGYFLLATPFQMMAQIYLLHHLSLMFLPILFLAFGIFFDVMAFVSLFGWGMSWKIARLQGTAAAPSLAVAAEQSKLAVASSLPVGAESPVERQLERGRSPRPVGPRLSPGLLRYFLLVLAAIAAGSAA